MEKIGYPYSAPPAPPQKVRGDLLRDYVTLLHAAKKELSNPKTGKPPETRRRTDH